MADCQLPLTALQADRLRQLARRENGGPPLPVPHCPAALLVFRDRAGTQALDRGRLAQAIDALVDRQAALRVRLHEGSARQLIEAEGPRLSVGELPGGDAGERRAAAASLLAERSRQELDSSHPMFEATWLPIDDGETALLVRSDQLVADLWSLNQIVSELGATYTALASGTQPPGALPLDYPTAVWDDLRWLDSEAGRAIRKSARAMVEMLTPLDLPSPAPVPRSEPPTDATDPWRTVRWDLAGPEYRRLSTFCRKHRSTLFGAILAAMGAAVAGRLSVDGVPVHLLLTGRDRPEQRPLVMWRSNTLPVWVSGPGRPARALLREAQQRSFEVVEFQRLPWPVIVQDHGRNAELDLSLQYIPPALNRAESPDLFEGLDVRTRLGTACMTGAAIDLLVSEDPNGIGFRCVSRRDNVDAGFVDAVLADIRRWLSTLADDDSDTRPG